MFVCVVFSSFSQTKSIEKGAYLSTNKGQTIKLNFLEGNKYELVLSSGEYKVKGDSLSFVPNKSTNDAFHLTFKNSKNAKKIKIKFSDASYYPLYIGTQKGTESIQYQRLSDIKTKVDPEWVNTDLEFDIDRADYLYLVIDGSETETETKLYKYALPKDVSEVTIKYDFDVIGDLQLSGVFDKKSNGLRVFGPSGKDPIVFLSEKDTPPVAAVPNITAIEKQSISNWTYPGKEALIKDDFGSEVAVDSVAVVADSAAYPASKFDFKFKIENNLKDALTATKNAKSKFLVISVDSKNPSAKADFDSFLKDQETQVGYNMYDAYNPEYDLFNYYLATAEDKKWLKTNKITDDPSIIILNKDGDVLATVKLRLLDKKPIFEYYFDKKLQRTNALYSFNKIMKNKKATDADLILAFNNAAVTELTYDYESDEVKEDGDSEDFKLVRVALDKKEVSQTWKKLIEAHQKDTKPNMFLVETILKEIKNQGFSKQFFKEDRVLNDTDFLSIDYLIKHYDAIEKENAEADKTDDYSATKITNLSSEISSALQINNYVSVEGVEGNVNQNKIISIYKKLIANGKGGFECYKNYFTYLIQESEGSTNDTAYLREFNTYFNAYLSPEKGNAIEKLDEMYTATDSNSQYSYEGWNSFKDYHSNLCNSTAWSVVLKPANAGFIKDAINWSEYSLIVTKNNPYYLDTLAQLYYKDGQKDKAIITQKLAVKFLNINVEEQTASEIRETLTKMQNGTY
jgi:hypothetical protein